MRVCPSGGCTEAELTMAGELCAAHDHVWMHTHLSENHAEIEATAEAFPVGPEPFAFVREMQPQRWGAEVFSLSLIHI